MIIRSHIKIAATALAILLVALIFLIFDPAQADFFPACPFRSLTGFLCPGCGSQRAMHQLLNFHFSAAYAYNPLLIISIPYLIVATVLNRLSKKYQRTLKLRQILLGKNAIWMILLIIVAFWIFRNV